LKPANCGETPNSLFLNYILEVSPFLANTAFQVEAFIDYSIEEIIMPIN